MRRGFDLDAAARTIPLRMPRGWSPPYPSWESEFADGVHEIAMILFGVQHLPEDRDIARDLAAAFVASAGGSAAAADLSFGRSHAGRELALATIYFTSKTDGQLFLEKNTVEMLWRKHTAPGLSYGVFREVYNIPLDRFETLHSGPEHLVGAAKARAGLTETALHAYWGSMRDRIPAAAVDPFLEAGAIEIIERSPSRILLRPGENAAVIRSGQDYRAAAGTERDEYLRNVEPQLSRGMAYLQESGREIGCLDCRYMRLVDAGRHDLDHTYGFAVFSSLAALEAWAEHHPTHLAIFNAFLEFAPRYGPSMRSRYWHEVSVLRAEDTWMEYANCVPGTGLMPT